MPGNPAPPIEDVISLVKPTLSAHFKPALLARMTVVPYYPIGTEALLEIVRMKLGAVVKRAKESHGIELAGRPEGLRRDRRSLPRGGERGAQRRSHPAGHGAAARLAGDPQAHRGGRHARGDAPLARAGRRDRLYGGSGMMVRAGVSALVTAAAAAALVIGGRLRRRVLERYARHRPAAEVLHVAGRRHDDHRLAEDQPRGRREPAPRPAAPLPAEDRHAAPQRVLRANLEGRQGDAPGRPGEGRRVPRLSRTRAPR